MIKLWSEHEGDSQRGSVCFLLFFTFAAVYRFVFWVVFFNKVQASTIPLFCGNYYKIYQIAKYIFEDLVFILSVPCLSSDMVTWS